MRRTHAAGGRSPRREESSVSSGINCVAPGYNVSSCVVRTIVERYQTSPGLEFPQLSREVVLALRGFKADLEPIKRYLDHLGDALRSTHRFVFRVDAEVGTPLAIHLRNPYMPLEIGVAWHPIFNTPYIPATSIKGVLRAYGGHVCGRPPSELFGDVGSQGIVVITDAFPTSELVIEADVVTPHYREPDFRETSARPVPLVFPVIRPGATFAFFIASNELERGCEREVRNAVAEAFERGLGAKTRLGYGVLRIK